MADDNDKPVVEPKNKGMEHPKFQAQVWKPGQSGNPDGRPKGKGIEEWVLEILEELVKNSETTKIEFAGRVFVDELLKRNPRFWEMYLKRAWPELTRHEVNGSINLAQWIQRMREEPGDEEETPT